MVASVPSWVTDAAILATAIAAVSGSLRVVFGWSLLRWFARRLITEPLEESLDHKIDHRIKPTLDQIMAELTVNGGSTMKDEVRRTAERMEELHDEVAEIKANQLGLAITFGEHLAAHDTQEDQG